MAPTCKYSLCYILLAAPPRLPMDELVACCVIVATRRRLRFYTFVYSISRPFFATGLSSCTGCVNLCVFVCDTVEMLTIDVFYFPRSVTLARDKCHRPLPIHSSSTNLRQNPHRIPSTTEAFFCRFRRRPHRVPTKVDPSPSCLAFPGPSLRTASGGRPHLGNL